MKNYVIRLHLTIKAKTPKQAHAYAEELAGYLSDATENLDEPDVLQYCTIDNLDEVVTDALGQRTK